MRDLKTVNALIDRIRNDYQFDPSSENYTGFLNVDPSHDWTIKEWDAMSWMVENDPDLLEHILEMRGLDIEGFHNTEVIFILDEKSIDFSLTQGRTIAQIESNERILMISTTALLIILFGVLSSTL